MEKQRHGRQAIQARCVHSSAGYQWREMEKNEASSCASDEGSIKFTDESMLSVIRILQRLSLNYLGFPFLSSVVTE